MRFTRRRITVGGRYFDRATLVHENYVVCFAAMRAFFQLRELIDPDADEQTLQWEGNTYTLRKINPTTWEVL